MSTDEAARLAALRSYRVLDTQPEPSFDRLTKLAADIFGAPSALVSLVDEERQWFKSRVGVDVAETPRSIAFCDHTIRLKDASVLVVEDATTDARFKANPLVTGAAGIRFYAGAKLTTPYGFNLGSLCVIDTAPRPAPTPAQLEQLTALAAVVVDELELRRVNRIANEKNRLVEMAEAMCHVGTWRYQLDGEITWSAEVYRIHGVTPEQFDPQIDDAIAFFHPDDRQKVSDHLAEAIAAKTGFEFQLRLVRQDGECRTVISRGACELDDRDEVVAIVGIFQDVTDSVRAVQAAQRSESRYRVLADNMADVVTRIRFDDSSYYVSPAVEALIGYTPKEMQGQTATSFIHPEDRHIADAAYAELFAGLPQKTLKYRAIHKDGHTIWVETNLRVVNDEHGKPREMVAVIRDISKRHALEEQLVAAREAAEQATKVKSEFVANMSHELRTPLTAVIGFSRLVAEQPELADETRQFATRATNAGKALLAIVNDILDFSKLEAGQMELRPSAVSPGAIVRETLDLFETAAQEKKIGLSGVEAAGLPAICSLDPDRLRQILLNLIGNAVKFTERGEVRVRTAYLADRQALEIRVFDTGSGMPREKLDLLFQRFSQIDGSSTRRHGGTGLGLAICKGLVDALGGEIGVESTLGAGSCFWVRIPAPVPASAGLAHAQPAAAVRLHNGCRILVVDDNAMNRRLVRAHLTTFHAEIAEADDGAKGVELAAQQPFDVILMDLRMPGLDGKSAAAQIRDGSGPNQAVPILAFSADSAPVLGEGLFDGVVTKPILGNMLIEAIGQPRASALAETLMPQHDPKRYRVMIAEDDRGVLELVRIRLGLVGYQVSYARDGVEALRVITATRPDAAILDVNMPELDGLEVLKAIKANRATAHIPVMMLTARNAPADVQTAISLGASDFLAKPFDDEVLLRRVARLVQSVRQRLPVGAVRSSS